MTVVCALLMIYLPTTSIIVGDVQLQQVSQADRARPAAETAVTLSFSKNGQLRWNDTQVSLDGLKRRLGELAGRSQGQPIVYLAGDRDARYGLSLTLEALLRRHELKWQKLVDEET